MAYRDDDMNVRDFDPDFDDIPDITDDIDVVIDGTMPGMLTEHGKIALLTKHCTNPDVRNEVRSWRTEGYTDEDGLNTVWPNMTWALQRRPCTTCSEGMWIGESKRSTWCQREIRKAQG
jgi:hypothetical protein